MTFADPAFLAQTAVTAVRKARLIIRLPYLVDAPEIAVRLFDFDLVLLLDSY